MKQIIDQIILFLFSFITLFLVDIDRSFITAMLASIIYFSFNFVYNTKICNLISTIAYALFSLFLPSVFLFLPLILYSILYFKNSFGLGILISATIYHIHFFSRPPLFLLLVLACSIAFLLQYWTKCYHDLEMTLKRTMDDSTERNLTLKEKNQTLIAKQDYEVYTATLRERNRIAREIHDNVGHMLSRSILMIGALKTMYAQSNMGNSLLQLESTLHDAMTSIRNSVHNLHDESIDLKNALTSLVDSFSFCSIHMDYDMGNFIPRNAKYSFIAITKEALNNIIKHSNASNVHITVREHPGFYQLIIEDNGKSISIQPDSGLGLTNMRDRVETLGGTIQFQTTKGFCVFITIPRLENQE